MQVALAAPQSWLCSTVSRLGSSIQQAAACRARRAQASFQPAHYASLCSLFLDTCAENGPYTFDKFGSFLVETEYG